MNQTLESGQRIELNQDCMSRLGGYKYTTGQVGTVLWRQSWNGWYVVDLDGYEEERQLDVQEREQHGEGFNIVPYIAEFPPELLSVV